MTDKTNNEETVAIPESEAQDFGSQQAKQGLSPAVKFGLVIGSVFGVIGVSMFMGSQEFNDPSSQLRGAPKMDATPGGVVQSNSPRYQQILEQANEEAAEQAALEGRTFIPTPERILRPIDDIRAEPRPTVPVVAVPGTPEPAPEPQPEARPEPRVIAPPPPPAPPQPRPVSAPVNQEPRENPYTASMLGQMEALAGVRNFSDLQPVRTGVVDVNEPVDVAVSEANGDMAMAAGEAQAQVLIPAGAVVYAETLTSTNSDMPGSPVLVELTTGEFRGSRLIGSFAVSREAGKMVVEFNTMTLPDGTSTSISAFAVDGMTAETAIASDVQGRYLQRYGPILASAFLSSYANAASQPEQTLVQIGDEQIVLQDQRTEEEALFAGLSAAADAIGQDLQNFAPKGPKIILQDGWPLGVMFMQPVLAE